MSPEMLSYIQNNVFWVDISTTEHYLKIIFQSSSIILEVLFKRFE